MTLHLEKAHDLPVRNLEFVRKTGSDKRSLIWTTVSQDSAKQTLLEIEFSLPGHLRDSLADAGQVVHRQSKVASSPALTVEGTASGESWTPEAMQRLYRERERQPD